MPQPPATHEEVAALLGDVDSSYVDRVVDTGASVDEIGEAIDELEGKFAESPHVASSTQVVAVREALEELMNASTTPETFSLRGVPVVQSV